MAILPKSKRLHKELGLFSVYALATGTTLSAGFFLLPGLAFAKSGPALPLAYLLAAVPLIPAMFSKVELATAMPRAGGVYYFLDRSMGPLMGTIGGIGTWLSLGLKAAFALIGMGAYLQLYVSNVPVIPIAVALAVFFGVINMFGAKGAGWFQTALVVGLLMILVWFSGGIFHIDPARFTGLLDKGWDSIFATAGLVYISYVGLTKVISVSEEVKNPERNLPLGVILALATAIGLYVVGTTIMVGVIPADQLDGNMTPVATAANLLVGNWGQVLVVAAALFAFSSVANAAILSASRYPFAMSRDHLLPSYFKKLSRRNIPTIGVLVTVGLILLTLVALQPLKIAKLASAFQLLLFALNCLAVIVMRESRIDSYDPGFRSPLYPWMQILGIVFPLGLMVCMGWLPILFSMGLLGAGTWWYFFYARSRVHRHGAIYHVFERLGRRRYAELDTELRGILKEKGLRETDPFDEIISRSDVIIVEKEVDFDTLARQAAELLARRVPVGADPLFEGFLRGTRIGATPVSHGAALPHLRLPGIRHPEMVLVRCEQGIRVRVMDEFQSELPLEEPIKAVFFLVSPEDNPGQHLRILAQVAGRVDDEDFMKQWITSTNEQEVKETVLRDERYLSIQLRPAGKSATLIGKALRELKFPPGCLIAIVRRGDLTFVPTGGTELMEGDRLTVIGQPDQITQIQNQYA